jgi:hypothetical protein
MAETRPSPAARAILGVALPMVVAAVLAADLASRAAYMPAAISMRVASVEAPRPAFLADPD